MSEKYEIKKTNWTAPNKQVFEGVELRFEGDPQPLFFRYDFNRLCDLESETGLNLGVALREVSAQQTRALVCAYLRTAHAVNLDEVGDLLTRNRNAVLEAMSAAMSYARIGGEEQQPESNPEDTAATV